jgi:hypothetical protein
MEIGVVNIQICLATTNVVVQNFEANVDGHIYVYEESYVSQFY